MRKLYSIEITDFEKQFTEVFNDIDAVLKTHFHSFEGFSISVPLSVYCTEQFDKFFEKIESLCIKFGYERSTELEQVFTTWSTLEEFKNSRKIIFRHRSVNTMTKEKSEMVFDKMTKAELVATISEYIKKVSDLEEINKLLDANISKQKERIDELTEERNKFKEKALNSFKTEQELIDERLKNKNQENYIFDLKKDIDAGNKNAMERINNLKNEVSTWKCQYDQLHEVLNAIYVRSADWDSQDDYERNESIGAINKLLTEVSCSGYATYVTRLEQKLEKTEKNLEIAQKRLTGQYPWGSRKKIPRMKFIRELFAGIITDMVFDGRTKEEMSILYDFTREFIDRYNKKTKEGLQYD